MNDRDIKWWYEDRDTGEEAGPFTDEEQGEIAETLHRDGKRVRWSHS